MEHMLGRRAQRQCPCILYIRNESGIQGERLRDRGQENCQSGRVWIHFQSHKIWCNIMPRIAVEICTLVCKVKRILWKLNLEFNKDYGIKA